MRDEWLITHGQRGFEVRLYRTPLHTQLLRWIADQVILTGTMHIFCCRVPEWSWKVPFGSRSRDDTGNLERSLGDALFSVGQRLSKTASAHGEQVAVLPVDRETGIFLWNNPEDSWLWDETIK